MCARPQPTAAPPTEPELHALFAAHWRLAYAAARRFTRTDDALRRRAADIAQQVLAVAWAKRGRFDPARGKFSNWLFGIAVRAVINLKRRAESRHPPARLNEELIPDHRPGPAADAAGREERARFDAAETKLSDRQRGLLDRKLRGEPLTSAADGCSKQRTFQVWKAAVKKLRRQLNLIDLD